MSIGAIRDCYATGWSYGEICVGCNACGRINKDKIAVNRAKLKYAKHEMQQLTHFTFWADNKELRQLQKKNIAHDKKYWREKINKIKAQLPPKKRGKKGV